MFCQKPLIFLKMDHSLHKYVLLILIYSPSTRNPSVHDEKQSALLAVLDYYVFFIPLNKALKPWFYVLDIEIVRSRTDSITHDPK